MRFKEDDMIFNAETEDTYFVYAIDGDEIHVEDDIGYTYSAPEEDFEGFEVISSLN